MVRSLAAVLAGYLFMAATVIVGTIVATALFIPGGLAAARSGEAPASLPGLYLAANLAISAFGAVLGGWLAARIATRAPFGHAVVLAAFVAAIAIVYARTAAVSTQPTWYSLAIGATGVAGVLLGGRLRAAARV